MDLILALWNSPAAVWNDPTMVRRLGVILQSMAISFVFLGGAMQIVKLIIDVHEKNLNAAMSAKKDQERQQKETELEGKLQTSREELSQVRTELEATRQARVEEERKRRTPPIWLADLKAVAPRKWYVFIKSENLIPFEFKYRVDTTNDLLVSPFMLEYIKIFPTEQDQLFHRYVNIDWERIKDRYVELKFTFRSLVPELFNEAGHRGSINKKYRVSDNGDLIPIE